MKKMKKLAALFLALMMALSCMAMPAAAYGEEEHSHECAECCGDEGIMPLYLAGPCPKCEGGAKYYPKENGNTWVECMNVYECGYVGWLY